MVGKKMPNKRKAEQVNNKNAKRIVLPQIIPAPEGDVLAKVADGVIANIASYLGSPEMGRMAQLSRYWLNRFKSIDAKHGNSIVRTTNEIPTQSIYGKHLVLERIKTKLEALGFEKELMASWTKGFEGRDTALKFEELIDLVRKELEKLIKGDFSLAKKKEVFEKIIDHLEIDVTAILKDDKYCACLEKAEDFKHIEKFQIAQHYYSKSERNLDYDKVFVNANPVVLYMALVFLPESSQAMYSLLLKLMGSQSLKALRFLQKYHQDNFMLNIAKSLSALLNAWNDWVTTNIIVDPTQHHLAVRTNYQGYVKDIITREKDSVSTAQILENFASIAPVDLIHYRNARSTIYNDVKLASIINENNIPITIQTQLAKIHIPIPGGKDMPFIDVWAKPQFLTTYLLNQAKANGQDLATFAEAHLKTIGFLHKLTVPQLKVLTDEMKLTELDFICENHNSLDIYKVHFKTRGKTTFFEENNKTHESSKQDKKAPKSYRAALLIYLKGYEEIKDQVQSDAFNNNNNNASSPPQNQH